MKTVRWTICYRDLFFFFFFPLVGLGLSGIHFSPTSCLRAQWLTAAADGGNLDGLLTQELGFLWVFLEGGNFSLFLEVEFLSKTHIVEKDWKLMSWNNDCILNENKKFKYYCSITENLKNRDSIIRVPSIIQIPYLLCSTETQTWLQYMYNMGLVIVYVQFYNLLLEGLHFCMNFLNIYYYIYNHHFIIL